MGKNGEPIQIVTLCSAKDAEILENWQMIDMRGVGSHDVAFTDAFFAGEDRCECRCQILIMPENYPEVCTKRHDSVWISLIQRLQGR